MVYGYRAIFTNVNKGGTQGSSLGLLVFPLYLKNDLDVKLRNNTSSHNAGNALFVL